MLVLISLQLFSQNIQILLHLMSSCFEKSMLIRLSHLLAIRHSFTLDICLMKSHDSLLKLLVILNVKIQDIIQVVLESFLVVILLLDSFFYFFPYSMESFKFQLHILDNQV